MLETVAFLSGLSREGLEALESRASVKRYRKNTIIIEKGDESATLYVLLSGAVRVYVADEEGREVVFEVLDQPGAHFGELALLRGCPRTASVATVEDSSCMVISRQDFLDCLRDNPQIALDIMALLVEKVQRLTDRVTSFALDDVYGRLAATLTDMAREEEGRLITPRVTQQDLAQRVGASREMVSRIFRELKTGGYISLEDKRIVLNRKLPPRW
jgi:CRP/FNR family transcriptional regulator, cyclic AMP receptor protein